MDTMEDVRDITTEAEEYERQGIIGFSDVIKAEQKGYMVLILTPCDKIPRFDGEEADYRIEYRDLSRADCITCVRSNEFTFWTEDEIDLDKGLFEQFMVF